MQLLSFQWVTGWNGQLGVIVLNHVVMVSGSDLDTVIYHVQSMVPFSVRDLAQSLRPVLNAAVMVSKPYISCFMLLRVVFYFLRFKT